MNDLINDLGATLVALTPQTPDKSHPMVEKHQLSFDLLSDKNNAYAAELGLVFTIPQAVQEVYSAFGIDVPGHNGDDSWTLPMPGRFVIDSGGIVRAVDVHPDYTTRPEPEKTLDDLRAL